MGALLLMQCKSMSATQKIDIQRAKIDEIDSEIVNLLSDRMEAVIKIGTIKKENKIQVLQPNRWNAVKEKLKQKAIERNLNPEMVIQMYEVFYQESVKQQKELQ